MAEGDAVLVSSRLMQREPSVILRIRGQRRQLYHDAAQVVRAHKEVAHIARRREFADGGTLDVADVHHPVAATAEAIDGCERRDHVAAWCFRRDDAQQFGLSARVKLQHAAGGWSRHFFAIGIV